MRSERFAKLSFGLCVLITAGCVDFDESIYKKLDPSKVVKDGGGDGGNQEAGMSMDGGDKDGGSNGTQDGGDEEDAGDPTPRLVDRCDDPTSYRLTTSLLSNLNEISFMASTVGFADDINQSICFGYPVPGSEGSLIVDMNPGERWHFHITPKNQVSMGQARQNPVLYMREDCSDNRGCNDGTALDLCGDAQEEHFTFESVTKSTWHFILDDKNNVQGEYLIRAVKNVCGNGIKEHNEACDTPGQGNCSTDCRLIVSLNDTAADEPNDDFSAAAILGLIDGTTGGTQGIKGSIGGLCDIDFYAITVPPNSKVSAEVLTAAKTACPAPDAMTSQVFLDLIDTKQVVQAMGVNGGDGLAQCPSMAPTSVPEGLYYLRVRGDETRKSFSYQLNVTVTPD